MSPEVLRKFWQAAALGYILAIFVLSSIPGLTPPSLGFEWEDKFYHFLEYSILSLLLFLALSASEKENWRRNAHRLAILIGVIYSATDEIHQHFVRNRQGDIWDWVADVCGVVLVQGVIFLVNCCLKRGKS